LEGPGGAAAAQAAAIDSPDDISYGRGAIVADVERLLGGWDP